MPTSLISTGVQFPDSTIQTTAGGAAAPAGTISFIAGTTTPTGYLPCDGAVYTQSTYPQLFARLGTIINAGTSGWTGVNPLGTNSYTVSYISQNNKFYVGFSGTTIYDSSDGANWSANTTTGTGQNFFGMMYGNGVYATVGTNSTYVTSSTGASGSWTQRSYLAGVGFNGWFGLFANGIFMVGGSGAVLTSTTALTNSWTVRTYSGVGGAGSSQVNYMAYNAGTWVLFLGNGTAYSKDNGVTWAGRSIGSNKCGTWGGGYFLNIDGTGTISYSYNGITWTNHPTLHPAGASVQSVNFMNGRWFSGDNSGNGWWSSDGLNWTSIGSVGVTGGVSYFAANSSVVVAAGARGGGSIPVGYVSGYTYNTSTQFVTPTQIASNPTSGNMGLYIKSSNN
jgi:hypothetical protein